MRSDSNVNQVDRAARKTIDELIKRRSKSKFLAKKTERLQDIIKLEFNECKTCDSIITVYFFGQVFPQRRAMQIAQWN